LSVALVSDFTNSGLSSIHIGVLKY